jgi:hypothetical protein
MLSQASPPLGQLKDGNAASDFQGAILLHHYVRPIRRHRNVKCCTRFWHMFRSAQLRPSPLLTGVVAFTALTPFSLNFAPT